MAYIFRVQAFDSAGQPVRKLGKPARITIDFDDLEARDWGQTFVQIYYFDDSASHWVLVPAKVDMAAKRIVAEVDHFTDFGFGGDANTLPSTPSNLEGFSVDLCTGGARAGISLKVPPGVAGMAPTLSLAYDSGTIDVMNEHWIADGNSTSAENTRTRLQASPLGLGWSMDLGAVFRSAETDSCGNPIFYLLLNGRTIKLGWVDGTLFKTEPDEFLRVRKLTGAPNDCSSHEYWVIEAKDGTTYRYGYNPDSEQRGGRWQFGSDGVQKAWQWSLDQISDTSGNAISIQYTEVSAQPPSGFNDTNYYDQAAYPSVINYTANSSQGLAANRTVNFSYSSRTDAVANTSIYTQYYLTQKLDSIQMFVNGSLVRTYQFAHSYQTPSWHTSQSSGASAPYPQTSGLPKLMLTSITELDASGNALPVTSFTYCQGTVPGSSESYKFQLATVSNGYGGVATFGYQLHTPDGWWCLPRRYRVASYQVDPGTGSKDGVSSVISLTYAYGSSYNASGSFDYRGHAWVTVTDSDGNVDKAYFYTRDAVGDQGDLNQLDWQVEVLQSRSYRRVRWASGKGESSYTTKEETVWSISPALDWGQAFVHTDEVRSYTATASGGVQSRKSRYEYDAFGNVVSTKEYDDAGAGVDLWVRNRVAEYYSSSPTASHYVVGKAARQALYDPTGRWLRDVHSPPLKMSGMQLLGGQFERHFVAEPFQAADGAAGGSLL